MSVKPTVRAAAMPRKIPALRFHKATGQYRVTLNGRDVWLGADPATAQQRYAAAVAEWAARGCQPAPPPPEVVTVSEIAARYLADRKRYYDSTPWNLDRVKESLKPLVRLYGDLPAAEVTPLRLKALRQTLIDRSMTRGYINELLAGIRRMLRWAVSEDLLAVEVYQRAATLDGLRKGFTAAPEGKRRQPLTEEELEAVRAYLPAPVMAALEVMFLTGGRPSEILRLRPCDIDRTVDPWRAVLTEHKTAHTGRERVIYFGPRAQAVVMPFLLRAPEAFLFSPREAAEDRRQVRHAARVTPMNEGNKPGSKHTEHPKRAPGDMYDRRAFARCISRAIDQVNADRKKADLPLLRRFSPYEARHGAATRIRAAVNLDAVQSVLGHSRVDMADHYAQLSGDLARDVMSRLG